jgi:hypothetical protein
MTGALGWSGNNEGSSTTRWTYVATTMMPITTSPASLTKKPAPRARPMAISRKGTPQRAMVWNGMRAAISCPDQASASMGTRSFIAPVIRNTKASDRRRPAANLLWAVLRMRATVTLSGPRSPPNSAEPQNHLRPNGWRVSGERRGEADERVRCTRVLGGVSVISLTTLSSAVRDAKTKLGPPCR